ncbi:MAG: HAD family hydrolase [Acidobacteriia bacterium]|nr:HAD family hydrolase [Terriglobia bacterium]
MRAVFLDRDGVINPLIYHKDVGIIDSPFTLAQFRVLARVPQAIRRFNNLGLAVVIVSNQPGIAKGHFGRDLLEKFDRKLRATLKPFGARIDATYYCLHHPEAVVNELRQRCQCRKPGIGLLTAAACDLGLSLSESYMVGDGITDVEAGTRAGCRTVFVGRWKCEICQFIHPHGLHPTFLAKDLWQASRVIQSDLHASAVA